MYGLEIVVLVKKGGITGSGMVEDAEFFTGSDWKDKIRN